MEPLPKAAADEAAEAPPTPLPFVSVILPARNEARFIERTLAAVLAQDYPADRLEVLVAEGGSEDGTRRLVEGLCEKDHRLRLIDNPSRIVATGLNRAIRAARGDVIVRVDGHTVIATDYVRHCVAELERTGADNAGGRMRARGMTPFGEAVALATSSRFGVGGAHFHYLEDEAWVDTVYLGAWRREVFARVGLFDEGMVRNQDDEHNYRLRANCGRILLSPKIRSEYFGRSTARSLARQYFQYGLWKVRVLQKHSAMMRPRQFAPPLFVLALGAALIGSLFLPLARLVLVLVAGSYLVANSAASIGVAGGHGWRHLARLPLIFAILHLAYGSGFLVGLIRFARSWGDRWGQVPAWIQEQE